MTPSRPRQSPTDETRPATSPARRDRRALVFLSLAAVCGLLHAAPSLYWAAGGTALLETVGDFAVDLARSGGPGVALMLLGVGLVKAAGALVPLIDHVRAPAHRWVRLVSWAGVVLLLVWGGAGTIGAWTGLATAAASWDQPAVVGHAVLWDPLFVLWGLMLGAGLWTSRHVSATPRAKGP